MYKNVLKVQFKHTKLASIEKKKTSYGRHEQRRSCKTTLDKLPLDELSLSLHFNLEYHYPALVSSHILQILLFIATTSIQDMLLQ